MYDAIAAGFPPEHILCRFPVGMHDMRYVALMLGDQPVAPETTKQSLIVSAKLTAQHFPNYLVFIHFYY